MGSMVTATLLAIFLVPVFFAVVRWIFPAKPPLPPSEGEVNPSISSS
jgi:hypothetical protein